jgi:hypothetical protein
MGLAFMDFGYPIGFYNLIGGLRGGLHAEYEFIVFLTIFACSCRWMWHIK